MLIKVFVYGTLKPGEENYPRYCDGKIIESRRAYTLGKLFALPQGYPAMTIGDSRIYGYLLTFSDEGVFADLDELEDYHPSRPKSANLYNRQQVEIFNVDNINNRSEIQTSLGFAWTYIMAENLVYQLKGIPQVDGWWSGNGINLFSGD